MAPSQVRCAIYTRKSSEEGLDQAFNSLHAQREACEAYVKSQAHEGWRLIKTPYDDGGISGATMDRPGLQRLLSDIDAGLVDTIVVYKIDRLTRSLADFGRIVERLEARGASFVSVTQAFNTTTSMGRLTLNVLLSFAQFEREVTGERIRDKIAASKKKGMWMGGLLPLGYDAPTDPVTRALVANPVEAETVCAVFLAYLDLGSVGALEAKLAATAVVSKAWTTRAGCRRGGVRLSRGALYYMLRNRLYLGEVPHRDTTYPGAHPPIVPAGLFDEVQAMLASQRRARKERPMRSANMLLTTKLFDADGHPMSPSFGYGRGGRIYRYYVSAPLQQGRRMSPSSTAIRRISAPALEERLQSELGLLTGDDTGLPLSEWLGSAQRIELWPDAVHLVFLIKDAPRRLRVHLQPVAGRAGCGELSLSITCQIRGGRTWVTPADGAPALTRPDRALIRGLRQGHRIAAGLGWSMSAGALNQLDAKAPKTAHDRRLCRLAFLAPDIQRAILDGRQPFKLTLGALLGTEIPLSWSKQRRILGFA
jgi:site-specific DNA recombinase